MTAPGEPEGLTSHELLLWRTCLLSLKRFYLPEAGILARRLIWDGKEASPTLEPSPRNTAEAAKALYLLRRGGFPAPLDPDALMERVVNRYLSELEYPDIALALWADALGGGRHFSVLWQALGRRFPSAASETMELGWTLSALCHCLPKATAASEVKDLAHLIAKKIARNQSPSTGLFHGSGRRQGWLRRRGRSASLSSQTYAIQALALYARVFNVPEAMQRARRCADAFSALQGPLGQWWWMYDVSAGDVREPYPVYSVNQDSAVPTAFGELDRTGEHRYAAATTLGLSWLFGRNELGISLVDEKAGIIWRAIEKQNGEFTIVREMYSYHPGRCLYRLCSRALGTSVEELVA